MGGPTVNQGAQNAEQANQQKAQQFAAQQQQAALAGVNNWTAQNKPPGAMAAPLQAPQAASPATMGGGVASGGQMPSRPPMPGQPPQGQLPQGQPPQGGLALNPQQIAHLRQLIGGQRPPGM